MSSSSSDCCFSSERTYSTPGSSPPAPPPEELPCSPIDPSDSSRRKCDNVIFDLGDVLFTWSAKTSTSISPKTLHQILRSAIWFEYEKGNLGEEECYNLVASEFKLDASQVAAAFQGARESLRSDSKMTRLLHEIKEEPDVRLYAMSNISAPDWEVLKLKGSQEDWALFERVFTSAEARERKPNLGYYRYALSNMDIDPSRTAFVDDKLENVLTARSLGLHGIIFHDFDEVERQLKSLFRDAVIAGDRWLLDNSKKMLSLTNTGIVLEENFAQLLILEQTNNPDLVDYIRYPRLSNFFKEGGVLTTKAFPCDLDTTSIALTISPHFTEEVKHDIMNEIVRLKNKDDIVQTYFDPSRPRIDPVVCCNVLTLFYSNGRGEELAATLDWVYDVLKHQAYTDGTLYYYGADTFFFFLSRLLNVSPAILDRFGPLFALRISSHFGAAGDALALAMRILAAATVGLCNEGDYEKLLSMQSVDGSWPMGWVYKYGACDILIGNQGLTTALAINAIKAVRALKSGLRYSH